MGSWDRKPIDEIGLCYDFIQDNHSLSAVKKLLRGGIIFRMEVNLRQSWFNSLPALY